eukprot:CAMPEP_0174882726 /NCGR_PEP_ID=MMETSP1114-20130205/84907_1 /TAXON_ID=312471 /ORGANISM="Neobodo designis, Strain CCAP 1951/1" /LENGTH=789 /DNA_ID=CAMNT_0016118127 /DNA_START=393 /DNA_END=2762 /DNA_ORIENTATION=+
MAGNTADQCTRDTVAAILAAWATSAAPNRAAACRCTNAIDAFTAVPAATSSGLDGVSAPTAAERAVTAAKALVADLLTAPAGRSQTPSASELLQQLVAAFLVHVSSSASKPAPDSPARGSRRAASGRRPTALAALVPSQLHRASSATIHALPRMDTGLHDTPATPYPPMTTGGGAEMFVLSPDAAGSGSVGFRDDVTPARLSVGSAALWRRGASVSSAAPTGADASVHRRESEGEEDEPALSCADVAESQPAPPMPAFSMSALEDDNEDRNVRPREEETDPYSGITTAATSVKPRVELPAAAVAFPAAFADDDDANGGNLDDDHDDDETRSAPCSPLQASGPHPALQHTDRAEGTVLFDTDTDSDDDATAAANTAALGDINQYIVMDRLGKGAQGHVFLAMDTDTDDLRAIKVVRRPPRGARANAAMRKKAEDLEREVAIMKKLRHKNVVRLYEVIDDPDQDVMYLVLQYAEHGPLATIRPDGTASRTVEPSMLLKYAQQLCSALQYLHANGVTHRDIKPENILCGANEQVFLADFGVSEHSPERGVTGTRGTAAFLAPELLAQECGISMGVSAFALPFDTFDEVDQPPAAASEVAGEPVDVWALGITLYALLYGKLPWEFTDARDLFEAIQRRPIELRPAVAAAGLNGHRTVSPGVLNHSAAGFGNPTPTLRSFVGSTEPLSARDGTEEPASPANLALFMPRSDSETDTEQQRGTPLGRSTSSAYSGTGGATFASTDEGWRRVLHGMLQRDPRRRTKLREVRRQLEQLDRRLEQARRMDESFAGMSFY